MPQEHKPSELTMFDDFWGALCPKNHQTSWFFLANASVLVIFHWVTSSNANELADSKGKLLCSFRLSVVRIGAGRIISPK